MDEHTENDGDTNLQEILKLAEDVARKAGRIILQYYQKSFDIERKDHNQSVTTADLEADHYLRETLLTAYPEYGWLSEETRDSTERLSKARVWVVDPLDGTREFIHGIPEFVVSVGLVEKGQPILGVIYNPVTAEIFAAATGVPTTYNGAPAQLTHKSGLAESSILSSRTEQEHGLWQPYNRSFGEVKTSGSVAYKMALTAVGKADFFVSLKPKNEWDICAGDFLIRNCGGSTLTRRGGIILYNSPDPFVPDGIVAGPQNLIDEAVQLFRP